MANNIQLKISADIGSAVQGINQVNQKLDQMATSAERNQRRFATLAAGFIATMSALGIVKEAVSAVVDTAKALVDAYSAQEQAEIKLQGVLTATAGAVGMSAAEMLGLADSLQKVTTYSDQEIIAVEQVLAATRKIGRDVMPEATKAVLDMAAATGDDAAGAAKDLAQALADPAGEIESLKEKGIQLTNAQAENIRKVQEQNGLYEAQLLLLKEVEGTYGGIATALADTDTGKLQQLKNAWTDLKEGLGEMLMNSIDGLVDFSLDLVEKVDSALRKQLEWDDVEAAASEAVSTGKGDWAAMSDKELKAVLNSSAWYAWQTALKAMPDYSPELQAQMESNPLTFSYEDMAAGKGALQELQIRAAVDEYMATWRRDYAFTSLGEQGAYAMETYKTAAQNVWASYGNGQETEVWRRIRNEISQFLPEVETAVDGIADAAGGIDAENVAASVKEAEKIISANSSLSPLAQAQVIQTKIDEAQGAIDKLLESGAEGADGLVDILEEIVDGLEEQKSALEAASLPVITHAASSSSTWLSSDSGLSTSAMLDDVNSRIWSGTQELSALEHAGKSGSSEFVYIQESIAALRQQKAALEEANGAAEDGAGAASGWVQAWTKALPITQTLASGLMDLGDSLRDLFSNLADSAEQSLDSITSKWDEYFDELDRKEERQSESLAAMLASGAISYEDYIEAMNSLDETRAEKEAEAAKEEEKAREDANNLGKAAFIAQQANAIAGATMSGAQAIMQVWADATLPTWAKGVQTGLVAATLATQIAAISAQQYTPLAAGGIVTSPTYALLGEGGAKEAVLPLTDYNLERTGLGRSEGTIQVIVNVGANYSQGQLAEEVFRGIEMAQRTGALPKWRYA